MKNLLFIFLLIMCFASKIEAQISFTYTATANPAVTYSERTKTTTITVSKDLSTITIVEGKASPVTSTYKVARLNTAPKGEYNLTLFNGKRFYITESYTLLYHEHGYAEKVWTTQPIAIR